MRARLLFLFLVLALMATTLSLGCRKRSTAFVIALSDNIKTIDPIGSPSVDAASERVRVLMFNSLVKKDAKFDYVPELASDIKRSDDGMTFTFTIRDGVTFHDGRPLTSADAKYTVDTVLASSFAKAASFFESSGPPATAANSTPPAKKSYVAGVEAPDARTLIIRLNKPWTGLLPNLVPIAIIPKDSYESEKTHPIGTGPFKFKSYDSAQQVVEMEANPTYWEGAPQIASVRARVIGDANALQAELKSGRVEIAPLPTSLSPDAIKSLGDDPNLQVQQFPGSNLGYLLFNCQERPLDNVKVRQAISYAVDRESMIRDLLLNQAKLAHSILPEESWAYTPGMKYTYDPSLAKKLLDEAGFPDPDGDGPKMRFPKPIIFKISGSSAAARQYSQLIQNYLKSVGVEVSIETAELNTLFEALKRGQFQMFYGQWVGGNQDPIFYRDLFATSEIPTPARASRNRSRYSNKDLDVILDEAANTFDRVKAAGLYARAQEIISRDVPLFPLWYQANMVVAKKTVGNIKIDASGDWGFVRSLTVK
ncbi:MAG: peptide/nickel transport system substrate-binding protein [Blastocatellia bacterium]|jgi:peptide/nickel transport system substrate-binding protein|nr:peptide/nickel transport system substrate-binding protein [Blastocatellia bacterium]